MKLVRKIVALTMVSLMLLALAACGGETASGICANKGENIWKS